ncbi:hypothetical protein PAMP_003201 [Pampus punctatissimus]
MEVSRRRILQKHLEPARPLRRSIYVDIEPQINAATCAQALMEVVDQESKTQNITEKQQIITSENLTMTDVGIDQLYKIINLHKQKEGRISYTRDFLIGLANCPEARKKPEFLPEHPIVLTKARDPGHLRFDETTRNLEKGDMLAERLHSP